MIFNLTWRSFNCVELAECRNYMLIRLQGKANCFSGRARKGIAGVLETACAGLTLLKNAAMLQTHMLRFHVQAHKEGGFAFKVFGRFGGLVAQDAVF